MKSLSEIKVSGSLAAMFSSTSITSILIGVLFYIRNNPSINTMLQVYAPAGTWSGIGLFSYITWIILWLIGYIALRGKKEVGSLRTWLIVFVLSVIIGTLIIEANLEWASLFE